MARFFFESWQLPSLIQSKGQVETGSCLLVGGGGVMGKWMVITT